MTLAIDGTTPASVKSDPTAIGSLTTAAFTPPSGSVLVGCVIFDTIDNTNTITMSTVTGSTSAWTTVEAPAVTNGKVGIYWATAITSTSTTVRATNNASSDMALKCYVFTGANTSTPVGAHSHTLIATNPTTVSYTATIIGSIGLLVEESWAGGTVTISNTTTDGFLSSNSAGLLTHQTTPSTGLTTQTFTVAGVTNSPALAYAEIIPAGSAGPASGASQALTATFTAAGVVNASVHTGASRVVMATLTAAGVLGYPNLHGRPAVVVKISNPPASGGYADTIVCDLYRTSPDGTTVRIAANLPPNSQYLDLLPGASMGGIDNIYTAVAYAASGAYAISGPDNTSAYSDVYSDVY
jgi:hypothetical protein